MKYLFSTLLLTAMAAVMMGCEASARVDTDPGTDTTVTKKTTVERDGDRSVRTEVRETR